LQETSEASAGAGLLLWLRLLLQTAYPARAFHKGARNLRLGTGARKRRGGCRLYPAALLLGSKKTETIGGVTDITIYSFIFLNDPESDVTKYDAYGDVDLDDGAQRRHNHLCLFRGARALALGNDDPALRRVSLRHLLSGEKRRVLSV
jgi:hypothetical protein